MRKLQKALTSTAILSVMLFGGFVVLMAPSLLAVVKYIALCVMVNTVFNLAKVR